MSCPFRADERGLDESFNGKLRDDHHARATAISVAANSRRPCLQKGRIRECRGLLQSGAMKRVYRSHLISLTAVAAASGFLIDSLHAATPDEPVLAPINAMFDGMAKRDAAAIKRPLLPGGGLVLMRDGKPTQMTFDAFAEASGKPGKGQIEERIHDPLVRIDNDLAVVWAPFELLVDGKVDRCGTDVFNLVHTDGKWLIASVAFTGRKNCGH